jgi:hypothetical protein
MKNIKIIRLATGEDVIGDIVDNDMNIIVKKSFVLIPRQVAPGQPVQLMLSPWQPYTDDQEIVVDKTKVITMINPKKDIKKNYEENTSGIIQATAADKQLITETKLPKV